MTETHPMQKLLEKKKVTISPLSFGQLLEGKVISKGKGEIVLDIGAKAEGIISGKELEEDKKLSENLKVGDKVFATVIQSEDTRGYVLLSLRKAAQDVDWKKALEAFEGEETLEVWPIGSAKGGILVTFNSLRGFIPYSHLSLKKRGSLSQNDLFGKGLRVKVIEVNKNLSRLIFSEKQALTSKEKKDVLEELLEKYKPGAVYEGEVTVISPYGIVVKLDELEGFVHSSELSWEKVSDPKKLFEVGQKVKVEVLGISEEEQRISLSIKRLQKSPWEEVAKKYKVGKMVKGKVVKIADFGAFVGLEPGIQGLIHVSETTGPLAVGEEVRARIIELDPEKHKISLSLKAVGMGWK